MTLGGATATWMGSGGRDLSGRLTALARLGQIGAARTGPDGFSPELLRDAEQLVARAGERLRLSANHTVAVLAGGAGRGKSSTFNHVSGAWKARDRCWNGWACSTATVTRGQAPSARAKAPCAALSCLTSLITTRCWVAPRK